MQTESPLQIFNVRAPTSACPSEGMKKQAHEDQLERAVCAHMLNCMPVDTFACFVRERGGGKTLLSARFHTLWVMCR